MAYLGSKGKMSQHIIDTLNNPAFDGLDYIEPFVGYCHILRRIENKKSYTASDNNVNLINLLEHVRSGKRYPNITKEQYQKLRHSISEKDKYRKAYAAYTYSYMGKEWGGYAGYNEKWNKDFPSERKRYYDKLRKISQFMNTDIKLKDYDTYKTTLKGKLIYCDPPLRKYY